MRARGTSRVHVPRRRWRCFCRCPTTRQIRLLALIGQLLFLAHLVGCGWFHLVWDARDGESWLTAHDERFYADRGVTLAAPVAEQYVRSIALCDKPQCLKPRTSATPNRTSMHCTAQDSALVGLRWLVSFYWALVTLTTVLMSSASTLPRPANSEFASIRIPLYSNTSTERPNLYASPTPSRFPSGAGWVWGHHPHQPSGDALHELHGAHWRDVLRLYRGRDRQPRLQLGRSSMRSRPC